MTENVIIIGGGPAGYTAALYAARANLNPLVFEGYAPGGQLMTTTDVENFPGFPEGIQGPELMNRMREQALRFGAVLVSDFVTEVDLLSPIKHVKDTKGNLHFARAVILATGATAKYLGLESEERLKGRGVSACATCDGFFFRGKTVAVVGGGDTALEEALYLANLCEQVNLIHRRHEFRASKVMQDRVRQTPNITSYMGYVVDHIGGNEKVDWIRLANANGDGTGFSLLVDGVFIAIGHTPNTELFKGQVRLDEQGYIHASHRTQVVAENAHPVPGMVNNEPWLPGVFAAGDVADARYRQAITAAGTGCQAALEAERYLQSLR